MNKFTKRPVTIEAIQYTKNNLIEVLNFCPDAHNGTVGDTIYIPTLEGTHEAHYGDWIIKGVKGEFYPCKPDIFEMTYFKATDADIRVKEGAYAERHLLKISDDSNRVLLSISPGGEVTGELEDMGEAAKLFLEHVRGGIRSFHGTFGWAVEHAKAGKKIARSGWNGSGMFAYIVPANSYPAQTEHARKHFGEMVPYREYWALKTAQEDVATWAPSGSDSLAEDWVIVE